MGLDVNQISSLLGKPTPPQEIAIDAKIEECYATLELEYNRKFGRATLDYSLRGTTAGQAIWHVKPPHNYKLRINLDLLHTDWDEMLHRTIPHEVAHIVTHQLWPQATSHGKHWALIMYKLGLPPDRCHTMTTKPARIHRPQHHYYCGSCGKRYDLSNFRHRKMLAYSLTYVCGRCRGHLTYEGSDA